MVENQQKYPLNNFECLIKWVLDDGKGHTNVKIKEISMHT